MDDGIPGDNFGFAFGAAIARECFGAARIFRAIRGPLGVGFAGAAADGTARGAVGANDGAYG